MILDSFAGSQWSYLSGVSGTATVPAGMVVRSIRALGGSGATLTVTPGGANQNATAGTAIPLPSATDYWSLDMLGELGGGTSLVFANTASYLVTLAKHKTGGP